MLYAPNKYGEIDNRPENFDGIAADVLAHHAVVVPWIDGCGTLYDVQFSLPKVVGPLGSGNRDGMLFVSILGRGAYGFAINGTGTLAPDYLDEKLKCGAHQTGKRMGDLIVGVMRAIESRR